MLSTSTDGNWWAENLSDWLISFAYFSIPLQLLFFLAKYPTPLDRKNKSIVFLFVCFIFLCGLTHFFHAILMLIVARWGQFEDSSLTHISDHPREYLSVHVINVILLGTKVLCSIVSFVTVLALYFLFPLVLEHVKYVIELEESMRAKLVELSEARGHAELANARKGEFMAYLCHELRNPLHVLTANIDFLLESSAVASAALVASSAASMTGSHVVGGASVSGEFPPTKVMIPAAPDGFTRDAREQSMSIANTTNTSDTSRLSSSASELESYRQLSQPTPRYYETEFSCINHHNHQSQSPYESSALASTLSGPLLFNIPSGPCSPNHSHHATWDLQDPLLYLPDRSTMLETISSSRSDRSSSITSTSSAYSTLNANGQSSKRRTWPSVDSAAAHHARMHASQVGVGTFTEEQRQYLRSINHAAEQMVSICNDVLDIAKLESGVIEFEHVAADLPLLCETFINLCRPQALAKNILLSLIWDAPQLKSRYIFCDPTRLHQIFLQIISNSIKFSSNSNDEPSAASSKKVSPSEIAHHSPLPDDESDHLQDGGEVNEDIEAKQGASLKGIFDAVGCATDYPAISNTSDGIGLSSLHCPFPPRLPPGQIGSGGQIQFRVRTYTPSREEMAAVGMIPPSDYQSPTSASAAASAVAASFGSVPVSSSTPTTLKLRMASRDLLDVMRHIPIRNPSQPASSASPSALTSSSSFLPQSAPFHRTVSEPSSKSKSSLHRSPPSRAGIVGGDIALSSLPPFSPRVLSSGLASPTVSTKRLRTYGATSREESTSSSLSSSSHNTDAEDEDVNMERRRLMQRGISAAASPHHGSASPLISSSQTGFSDQPFDGYQPSHHALTVDSSPMMTSSLHASSHHRSSPTTNAPEYVWVEFVVIDNGVGMSRQALSNIFTPYSESKLKTYRSKGGNGLGLCVVKEVITQLGGEIIASSVEGQGSIFTVRLRFQVAQQSDLLEVYFASDDGPVLSRAPTTTSDFSVHDGGVGVGVGVGVTSANLNLHLMHQSSPPPSLNGRLMTSPHMMQRVPIIPPPPPIVATESSSTDIVDFLPPSTTSITSATTGIELLPPTFTLQPVPSMVNATKATASLLPTESISFQQPTTSPPPSSTAMVSTSLPSLPLTTYTSHPSSPLFPSTTSHPQVPVIPPLSVNSSSSPATSTPSSNPASGSVLGYPITPATTSSAIVAQSVPSPKQSYRILVVDDNEINRKLLTRMLKSLSYEVDTAEDGLQAFEAVKKNMSTYPPPPSPSSEADPDDYQRKLSEYEHNRYVLIVMDISMPVMDGHQSAAAIRQHGFTAPIVALTANALAEERTKAFENGMNMFLCKPIRKHEVVSLMKHLCGHSHEGGVIVAGSIGASDVSVPSQPGPNRQRSSPSPAIGSVTMPSSTMAVAMGDRSSSGPLLSTASPLILPTQPYTSTFSSSVPNTAMPSSPRGPPSPTAGTRPFLLHYGTGSRSAGSSARSSQDRWSPQHSQLLDQHSSLPHSSLQFRSMSAISQRQSSSPSPLTASSSSDTSGSSPRLLNEFSSTSSSQPNSRALRALSIPVPTYPNNSPNSKGATPPPLPRSPSNGSGESRRALSMAMRQLSSPTSAAAAAALSSSSTGSHASATVQLNGDGHASASTAGLSTSHSSTSIKSISLSPSLSSSSPILSPHISPLNGHRRARSRGALSVSPNLNANSNSNTSGNLFDAIAAQQAAFQQQLQQQHQLHPTTEE